MKKDKISIEDQKQLLNIDEEKYTLVRIPRTNKTVKVGWMKPDTLKRVSRLVLESGFGEEEEGFKPDLEVVNKYSKFCSQYAALIMLNGIKSYFFYNIFWRWLYYIKGYDYDQLMPIILTAKKKVPSAGFLISIISARGMMVTNMTMTKKEQELYQSALTSE